MQTLKSLLKNPFLLGAQGFAAGALLLWSTNEPPRLIAVPAPIGASLIPAGPATL